MTLSLKLIAAKKKCLRPLTICLFACLTQFSLPARHFYHFTSLMCVISTKLFQIYQMLEKRSKNCYVYFHFVSYKISSVVSSYPPIYPFATTSKLYQKSGCGRYNSFRFGLFMSVVNKIKIKIKTALYIQIF